ncbi:MAG: DUF167 domain-containing protein [bacterium]|nr:DUF167 domain-containing protein [bacterium]
MRIHVHAVPGARKEEVVEMTSGESGSGERLFRVSVKEPPVAGRANRAIISALADYFGVPETRVRIVSGAMSRRKIIAIEE